MNSPGLSRRLPGNPIEAPSPISMEHHAALTEMLDSEGWRLARQALKAQALGLQERAIRMRPTSLEDLLADQRLFAFLDRLIRDPLKVLTPSDGER